MCHVVSKCQVKVCQPKKSISWQNFYKAGFNIRKTMKHPLLDTAGSGFVKHSYSVTLVLHSSADRDDGSVLPLDKALITQIEVDL